MAFFADVLGTEGKVAFVFAVRDGDTPLTHKWVDLADPEAFRAAVVAADELNSAGADVYFTPAAYAGRIVRHAKKDAAGQLGRTRGRRKDNVASIRSFWVDIDAGEAKWANEAKRDSLYQTKRDALVAVGGALDAVGSLPDPSYIIDSGTGIHLYWALTESLEPGIWVRIAERLRDTLLAAGLKLDRARSKDVASIMRFPGSIHWGETERGEVEIRGRLLDKNGKTTDPEVFVRALSESKVKLAHARPRAGLAPSSKATTIGGIAVPAGALARSEARAREKKLGPPAETDHNIKMIWDTLVSKGSDLSYEDWRNVIWAVQDTQWECAYELLERWCALSDTDWGKPWPDELRKVWDSNTGTGAGKVTCGSLIAWAREELGDPTLRFLDAHESKIASEGGQVVAVTHPGRGEQSYVLPKLPQGFMRKESEPGIWARVAVDGMENEEEPEFEWTKFVDVDVFLADRITEADYNESMSLVRIAPHDGMAVFNVSSAINASLAKTAEALAAKGIIPNGKNGWKIMSRYLIEQGKALIQNRKATSRLSSLGWQGAGDERMFVFGNAARDLQGNKHPVRFTPRVAELARSTEAQGTLDRWKQLAALYEGDEYAPAQALILISMGAPLHALTGEAGGVVNLWTTKSGYGKTAILRTALSVWSGVHTPGMSETLMMGKTTDVGSEIKLTQANSLPVGMDEITKRIEGVDRKAKESMRDFIYHSTQGQGKTRSKSSADGLRPTGSWDTFLLTTANSPLESLFADDSVRGSEAERVRTLDLDGASMPFVEDFVLSDISVEELMRRREILTEMLPVNYGVAGEALLTAYFEDFEATKARVTRLMAEYTHRFSTRERFILAKLAAARVAWETASLVGLVKYRWEPVEAVILGAIAAQKAANASSIAADPAGVLNEYIRRHASQIAMVRHSGGKPIPYGLRIPRDPLVGRWEVDRNVLYLMRSELKTFCAENRLSLPKLDAYLSEIGALTSKGLKVSLGKGHGLSGQHFVMAINPTKAGIVPDEEEEK